MEHDLTVGEDLFRDAIRAFAKDIAHVLVPGSHLGMVLIQRLGPLFCQAAWNWLYPRKPTDQQQALNGLTQLPVERVQSTIETELAGYRFGAQEKADILNYLSAIPMAARQAISRPDDGGRPTTLLSQLPRSPTDLLRFVPLRPPRFRPGDRVPGYDYQCESLLGQGGFGEVWKAQHILRSTQPAVALKFCLDPTLGVSLKQEIRVWDILHGHNAPEGFVRLYDTAYSADPPFLIYEYIDGGDLIAWLASFDGKRPSVREVLRVFKMAAQALAFAHHHGIVHRDLKPANLLVTRAGRIKISDFGIGAIMADARVHTERCQAMTGATLLRGAYTPLYTDPLQGAEAVPHPKVDMYALGIIAYQLLTGDVTQPMGPAWRADLQQNQVPTALIEVIEACVDLFPRRLANAGALLTVLERLDTPEGRQDNKHYCTQCGRKVLATDRFCTRCGQRLG